ncbi:hypothetical protein Mapa_001078 [Marchantia paleacea]|nr:hypothetical protein Mapa_001078 [Marchantia paleacea]
MNMTGGRGRNMTAALILCTLCIAAGIPSALSTKQPENWDWFPGHGGGYTPPSGGDSPPLFPAPEYPPDSPPYYDAPPLVGTPPVGGSPPYDGGSPPYDGGSPPYDGGSPPYDGGSPPYDGGSPPYDGGSPPYGGGSPPYDGGSPPYDGGSPPYDGGSPPYDGGIPPIGSDSPPYYVDPPTYPIDPPTEEPIPWAAGCTASYWASTAEKWPEMYTESSTIGDAFGKEATAHYGDVTLLDALLVTGKDGYSSLMKHGVASLFNSHKMGFQYSTEEVKMQFNGAMSSEEAAAAQAVKFENANKGYNV